jgi:hypothetical protein
MRKFIATLGALWSLAAHGENGIVLGKRSQDLVMTQIPEPTLRSPTLIGGDPVSPTDYPGVFYTSQGNSRCTGTLIGNYVVASAAHCMANGASLTLTYKGVTYTGRCNHAPQYRENPTADLALCKLATAIPDAIAENINAVPSRPSVGDKIRLMGYGCINSGGGGGNDGILRSNLAKVTRVPVGTDYDTITRDTAALCFGDSGGPSFVYDETGKRYQLAVNSRGNIQDTSYLATIALTHALNFYRAWSTATGATICGLHPNAVGCREQGAPPPELPASCKKVLDQKWHTAFGNCLIAMPGPGQTRCKAIKNRVEACFLARYPE